MIRRFVVQAALAAALGLTASAAVADGEKERVYRDSDRRAGAFHRDSRMSRHAPVRRHYRVARYHHRHAYRAWDGRYGMYPRRHFFVTGVHAHGYYGSPVSYATVTHQTYVYYTPTYPSLSYGYPPYAHVYDIGAGPIYNKPCLC